MYSLTEPGSVQIVVYDHLGRKIATLLDEHQDAGSHSLNWDGTDDGGEKLSAGVYFLKFTAGEYREAARVVILR